MKKLFIIIGIFFFTTNLAWSEECCSVDAGFEGLNLPSIKKKLKATPETKKAAYNVNVSLTESIYQSIDTFSRSKEAKEIFGETFIELFCSIKDLEVNAYNKIITAWEREYLLLNV